MAEMQYNIANLPALMFRETSMLGVSAMMLHHLIVTFKTSSGSRRSFVQYQSNASPAALLANASCCEMSSAALFVCCLFARCARCSWPLAPAVSISMIEAMAGGGGQNLSSLVGAWVLTKFCGEFDRYMSIVLQRNTTKRGLRFAPGTTFVCLR